MEYSISALDTAEEIGQIDVRSANQNVVKIAREIVDKLDQSYYSIVDLSVISSDQNQIVIWGVRDG